MRPRRGGGRRSATKAIGVLGGTFDPVHVGHLAVGEVALAALDLDRVLLMPASLPPHKLDRPITDAAHREAMLRLAIAAQPGFEVSRIELERPGPSYAVDTIARARRRERCRGPARAVVHPLGRGPPGLSRLARPGPDPGARADRGRAPSGLGCPRRGVARGAFPRSGGPVRVPAWAARRGVRDRGPPPRGRGPADRRSRAPGGRAVHHGAPSLPGARRPAGRTREERRLTEPAKRRATQATGAGGHGRRGSGSSASEPGLADLAGERDAPRAAQPPQRERLAGSDRGRRRGGARARPSRRRARSDKKASDIVLLDVRAPDLDGRLLRHLHRCLRPPARRRSPTASSRGRRPTGVAPLGREGDAGSRWLLIDFGSVIVHVMSGPEREFYQLEKLWSDASLLLHVL